MTPQGKTVITHHILKVSFRFLIISLIIILSLQSYSQRQADRWYFGRKCGLDFSTGEPVVRYDGLIDKAFIGCGTICDSLSNLLFYHSHGPIYTSQHTIMENSENFDQWGNGTQNGLIVPWPESDSLYFVFKIDKYDIPGGPSGLFYNVVDISKNNGLGAVIEKDILLQDASGVTDILTAVLHKNKRDIWIITRDLRRNEYVVFLITPDGINENAVLSEAPHVSEQSARDAYMKLSYNKKYLLITYKDYMYDRVEISRFNSETGEVEWLNNHENDWSPIGLEFSPDSKFVYISYVVDTDSILIRQYDMQYIEDPLLFSNSAFNIGGNIGRALQLATDGKIYCLTRQDYLNISTNNIIGVIHKPWELGLDCEYQESAINMAPGVTSGAIPNILLDYLYRFDFDGICEGELFQFTSFFNPVPSTIYWTFNDPLSGSNHSNELNPTHIFSNGGSYEVEVDVWYPSGRFEHTSRVVEVEYGPNPDLGPDTALCINADIVLNAECGDHQYVWSTGQFGSGQITVSDTGWYWVEVTSDGGCFGYDSIHISKYGGAIVDSSNLILSPTTCGGNTGAIRGLEVVGTPPYSYQWFDDLGNPISTTIDMYQLPVGNYTLLVIDGNACTTEFGPYSIIDVGDVLVESVTFSDEHCDQMDGNIIITATSGLGDMLYYSIDNGSNYFQNLGVFTGLSSGSYAVRVQDSTLCEDAYVNNPIILQNHGSPEITDVQSIPETVGMSNGQINIVASSPSDTIYYSNDAGATIQINDGSFINLPAGFYTCVVSDLFGCDTTIIVEVPEFISLNLEAIAGEDGVCPGTVAHVPLLVSNFNDVKSFNTTLLFDNEKLICQGYTHANSQLEDSLDVLLFPAEGRVELQWSDQPVTLSSNSKLIDIVFDGTNSGTSLIEWDGTTGANAFYILSGTQIPVNYHVGEVVIYKEVDFSLHDKQVCEGETVILTPWIHSSNGDVTFQWTYPNGTTGNTESLVLSDIRAGESGEYAIKITDTAGCYMATSTEITVYEIPSPQFAILDTIFTEDPMDLDAGYGFLHYWWNTGDTTQTIWVENEGWYMAEVESQQGCIGEDSSYVVFTTTPELINVYFPNAFTPNGDGLNDEFKVVTPSMNVEVFSLSIFNRWGAQIFHTSDISKGWDGTYRGTMCQAGSYVFKVSYNTSIYSNTAPEVKMGTVMLVR